MAFAATDCSPEPRSYSVGPLKEQLMNWSAASGDTTGTITADALSSISYILIAGMTQTAAPTFSGNVATIAFADPVATVYGQVICYGK